MKYLRILFFALSMMIVVVADAQGGGGIPGPPGATGSTGGTTGAPVDGASGVLLLAAAAYGYKQLRNKGTKQHES